MALPRPHIFVSHSHLDNDFGTQLAQDLRRVLNDENAVFYDVLGGLHGGERWWESSDSRSADCFPPMFATQSSNCTTARRQIAIRFATTHDVRFDVVAVQHQIRVAIPEHDQVHR